MYFKTVSQRASVTRRVVKPLQVPRLGFLKLFSTFALLFHYMRAPLSLQGVHEHPVRGWTCWLGWQRQHAAGRAPAPRARSRAGPLPPGQAASRGGAPGGPGLGRPQASGPANYSTQQAPRGAEGAVPARRCGAQARRRRAALSKAGCDWLRAAAGRGPRSDGRSGANGGAMVPGPGPRAALSPARRKRRRRRRRRGPWRL